MNSFRLKNDKMVNITTFIMRKQLYYYSNTVINADKRINDNNSIGLLCEFKTIAIDYE